MRNDLPDLGPLSVEEFLAFENGSPTRHEFVAGRVYAMSGTTLRHNKIATNIHAKLRATSRRGPCEAFIIDIKVRAARDRIYYPDCVVACAPPLAGETTLIADPCMIVEVTSPSTRRIDRGEKLDGYLGIPSLRGYLIAEQARRHVTLHRRDSGGNWVREEAITSGSLVLPCLDAELSLDEVYEGVELPPLSVREAFEDDEAWALEETEELDAEW